MRKRSDRWRSEFGDLKGDQVKRLKGIEAENNRFCRAVSDPTIEKLILKEAAGGKLLSSASRHACVALVVVKHGVSERLACRVLGQHRSIQRKNPTRPHDEAALTADITSFATQCRRYGYRHITAMLRQGGGRVNATLHSFYCRPKSRQKEQRLNEILSIGTVSIKNDTESISQLRYWLNFL